MVCLCFLPLYYLEMADIDDVCLRLQAYMGIRIIVKSVCRSLRLRLNCKTSIYVEGFFYRSTVAFYLPYVQFYKSTVFLLQKLTLSARIDRS